MAARGQAGGESDPEQRQWNPVHLLPLPGDNRQARYHPSAHSLPLPGVQQLHRMVPSQLEGGGGSLDGGVPELGRSASIDRPLDRGVQSRPASSGSGKSRPARGLLGFHSCTQLGGPDCLVLRGAIQRHQPDVHSTNHLKCRTVPSGKVPFSLLPFGLFTVSSPEASIGFKICLLK